ncbi:MAG: FtsX-like permease family protein [Bacteroidota bacterium]
MVSSSFLLFKKLRRLVLEKCWGGTVSHVLGIVIQDFFTLIVIAGAIATPLAWYFMSQWLENFEYRTTLNWWVYALAVALVMIITLLAISYQALRAATASPVKSLRTE